mmetsp:Transcript_35209/g.65577  ORF Transcript_35209/g.65577 Transcript_35209/m.65577 type:complete len:262 (+) Transcript_35209:1527-2312(+)
MREDLVDSNRLLPPQLFICLLDGHHLFQTLRPGQIHQDELPTSNIRIRILRVHQALDHHGEEAVRPRRNAIPRRFHVSASAATTFEHLAHLIGGSDGNRLQALAHESFVANQRVLLHLQLGLVRFAGQKVNQIFSHPIRGVDLQKGCLHREDFSAGTSVPDELEDALGSALNDALLGCCNLWRYRVLDLFGQRLLGRTTHCMGLARACNSVAEDNSIVAFHHPVHHRSCVLEDFLLCSLLAEVTIAAESLCFLTAPTILLF